MTDPAFDDLNSSHSDEQWVRVVRKEQDRRRMMAQEAADPRRRVTITHDGTYRAGRKANSTELEDLKKAEWYLRRYLCIYENDAEIDQALRAVQDRIAFLEDITAARATDAAIQKEKE